MSKSNRLSNTIREVSPCLNCPERFIACSDKCPKDDRGEYGYKAWKAEIARVKKAKKDYLRLANARKKTFYGGENDNE